jgi:predicted secreted Zn-dependent protease
MFKAGKVFVQSVFNTNENWVVPEGRNDYVLRHEQIHFDITEIYSRKLRKELDDANITSDNADKAKPIFEKIFNEMERRQIRYDQETQRGDKSETQEHWEAVVELELAKYEFYKSN